jgi:hypothetical protein
VDGTGSGSRPVVGFGISGVESWDSISRELVTLQRKVLGTRDSYTNNDILTLGFPTKTLD